MSNRILSVSLRDHSLVAAEAEIHVTVVPERLDAGTEVRGRLMGPQCRFASTVEVAYHLRPLRVPTGRPGVTLRAVIPEASFWEPQTPHLYAGPVELWQDGQRAAVVQVRRGLRHLTVGPRGLRLNGRPLQLRGRAVASLNEESALSLREQGYNLVVAAGEARDAWEVADRIGLFVLAWEEPAGDALRELAGHPSHLGWLNWDECVIAGEGGPLARVTVARGRVNGNGGKSGLVLDASPDLGGESALGSVEI